MSLIKQFIFNKRCKLLESELKNNDVCVGLEGVAKSNFERKITRFFKLGWERHERLGETHENWTGWHHSLANLKGALIEKKAYPCFWEEFPGLVGSNPCLDWKGARCRNVFSSTISKELAEQLQSLVKKTADHFCLETLLTFLPAFSITRLLLIWSDQCPTLLNLLVINLCKRQGCRLFHDLAVGSLTYLSNNN